MSIKECLAWKHHPSLGKLPYLKKLILTRMRELEQIDFEGGFPHLKLLSISDCEQWKDWSGLKAEMVPWCPLLQKLIVKDCPKLNALPPLPLSLHELELSNVGLVDSPTFWMGDNCGNSISSSSCLRHLQIERCQELTSVAGLLRHRLTSLLYMEIKHCKKLVYVNAEEGFQHLYSIEDLWIEDCPKLKLAPNRVAPDCIPLSSSLRDLNFSHCSELDRIFPTLMMQGDLTSLSEIKLHGANHITSFPSQEVCRRLTSLVVLRLRECVELKSIEGLKALTHLYDLTIRKCPRLVRVAAVETSASIEGDEEFTLTVDVLDIDDPLLLHIEPLRNLASVRKLLVEDCRNLEATQVESWLLQNRTFLQVLHLDNVADCLPSSLQTLSSLKVLRLTKAYELQSLPQLPWSLRYLMISGCNETLKERCRKNEGADWPNIQHIPDIKIYT